MKSMTAATGPAAGSKHTPGPWSGYPTGILKGSDWVVTNAPDEYGRIMSEANARLIAAAPELLEALLIARDYAGYAHAEPEDIALIDAAIAKATGATP